MRRIIGFTIYGIMSIAMLVGGLWFLVDEQSFSARMRQTIGEITSDPAAHTTGGRRTRHIEFGFDYAFTVDGREYHSHGSTRARPDETVIVYYNSEDPSDCRVSPPSIGLALVVTLLGALGCIVFFDPFRWFWREKD